jgi:ribosomal protein S18 acetylase RimI-like enzyme
MGIGKIVMNNVFNYLYERDYRKLIVVTQGRNYAAQKLYQRSGFVTSMTEVWYHKWL